MKFKDLRSDTVTWPTQAMRDAMYTAEVGDDVYGDDPTTKALEEYSAQVTGMEAALFVPSGTFGNQLALLTHCKRGDEVILDEGCHIMAHEVGASAVIAGVQLRSIKTDRGVPDPSVVASKIRSGGDIHEPDTGLICLENAHSNGRVIPLANMESIYSMAKERGIPVHLDGARLFNASAYLGVDPSEITQYCDSVMFCLSKGLCAPVGSILAGTRGFIDKARKGRKLMGGGLRQAGILAAAGLVALKEIRHSLGEDHRNALLLGSELSKIPGLKVFMEDIHINMVYFDMSEAACDPAVLVDEMLKRGIKINPVMDGLMRFVTHYWIKEEDVLYVAKAVRKILG